MKAVLIGSRALKFWIPDFKISENADWDIVSYEQIDGAEWHRPDQLNNSEILEMDFIESIDFNGQEVFVAPLRILALIKRSHLYRNIGFDKHITQYHKHLKIYANGYQLDGFYVRRLAQTKAEYGDKFPSLMQPVDEFFDDYVEKKYDHDMLHRMVAFYDVPIYTKIQQNPELAWCDYDLWLNLSDEEKTKCVAEEATVIAIERFIIPFNAYHKISYIKALNKICTNLTSGWFRDWAIDHYPEVIDIFPSDRIESVVNQLERK